MCHAAARTSPMTTTCRGNLGVAKNSRIAKRYTMPASVKETMKYGPPRSPKLRKQMVNATHNVAPSKYTLRADVIFIILVCPSATVGLQARVPGTSPYKALIPYAFAMPTEFDRFLTFFHR